MENWQYHMVIAPHLLNSKIYSSFYISHPELWTIIDNGLWEGQVVDNNKLIALATMIHANEIIAPDDPTAEGTIKRTKSFLEEIIHLDKRDAFYIHGVVHGETYDDRVWCLEQLLTFDVDVIDLPKMLGYKDRAKFLDEVTKRTDKPVHFLGYYKEEKDLLAGQWCTHIRSFDTSVPFKPDYTKKFDLDLPLSEENYDIIAPRLDTFRQLYSLAGGDSI